jgi:hypothetical protein
MVNRPIGYWVRRLDEALETHLDSTLARVRLTRRQWQVLSTLSSGPVSPTELKHALRPFTAADGAVAHERDMAGLVRRDLVFLLDGQLSLTDAGVALHAAASALVDAARLELTAGIGVDEYAMAVSVLERMSKNAERLAAGK